MEPDQPPSTSSTSAPPSDPLYSLQPASTDQRPFHDNRSDERLLDPSAPPQGTSMWPGMFQENLLSDLSYHSSMPGGNGATVNFDISNVPHTNMHYDSLSLGTPSKQFQHSNAPQHSGTLEYPYFGQPRTIYPFPANNIVLGGLQQSTSLPQSNLGPHPQSQEPIELDLLYPPFHANTLSALPGEAVTTRRCHEPVDESGPRVTGESPSAVRGIGLESPRAADGETTVHVRRDTCITLNFDMQNLSNGSIIYDGLKIPSTPSVRSHCSEDGKKLLHLEIRVLGATTRNEYGTVCHICKDREGDRDAFPDFRAKGNVLVPKKNGKLLVSFTLACYSKHREPRDSQYCLKVILNGGTEQNNPLIEYELPYSFSIVTRLPPQPRSPGEVVGDAAPPPNKRPRTRSRHAGHAGNPAPQSVVSSDPDENSSGDSRGSKNSIPSGTSENIVPPMEHRRPVPPAEAVMPSHQCRQTVNTSSGEEVADGQNLVIERINPGQGPTAGGPEIWISGSNFPTRQMPLYARFGDNCAHVVSLLPGLLSCRLPPANVPGMVQVWLSHSLDPNAPVLGTSLCQFEYVTDLNQILPVIIRIQENSTPEVAAGLDVLHVEMKKRNLKTNEKRPLREEEARHNVIETAIIQALAPLHNTPDFGGLISKTNDYKQTLAHFAVLFGYTSLLEQLVEWNIDLTIADVNGFTALHCAYKMGGRICVDLLLEKGASGTVLDALGRTPSQLMPKGFASLNDRDTDMTLDGQPKAEQQNGDAASLLQSADSGHGSDEKSKFHYLIEGSTSAPSQETPICPETLQGECLPDPPNQSSMHHALNGSVPRGNGATATSVPHSNTSHEPLNLGTLPPPTPLGTSKYPHVEQPQTIYPLPATNVSLNDWEQSTPPPQNCLYLNPLLQGKVQAQMSAEKLAETTRSRSQERAEELALAKALAEAKALVKSEAQARGGTALARDRARALALKQALALVEGQALQQAPALVQRQALKQAPALVRRLARAVRLAREPAQAREPVVERFSYCEVLADSKLKDIIYSIKLDHRYSLARHLCGHSNTEHQYRWLIQIITPITRLPFEVLQHILLMIIDDASLSPSVLMLVCKYWYTSVNIIWASLKIGTRTSNDTVQRKLRRKTRFLDVSVDTENPSKGVYEAIFAAIEASSRWRSFVVEMFPTQADLPAHLVNIGLQRSSGSVMSHLRTFKFRSACEMSPLLDHLLRILGTSASDKLTTVEINSPSVISLLAPTYPSIFHSIKELSLDTPGLPNSVDLLPHLHQLESLTASHLLLPTYHNHVNLPFVHTLRHLSLRAVSVQWMSGRTFHALESCTLLFPLHRHVLRTFGTNLPNCKQLTFEGYPLNILDGVSTHRLAHLSVTCSSSYTPRGTRQLVRFSSQALRESRLAPRILHISIEAANEAWITALAYMSNLEELVIDNAQPSSLGATVLRSLVVHPIHANNRGTTATLGGRNTPVCPSLKRFGLQYRRWLRPSEHFDLIPELISIICSRQRSKYSLQSFQIWIRSDQQDPVELIAGGWINFEGFERLTNDAAIRENLLQLMAGRLAENMLRPSGKSSTA